MYRPWLPSPTLVLLTLIAGACGNGGTGGGGDAGTDGGATQDLAKRACDAGAGSKVDFAAAPTGRAPVAGDIGFGCTTTADCKKGPRPVCWPTTLFNNTRYLPTAGGYCSSTCATDADCADSNMDPNNPNLCIDFGGTDGKACIAGCGDAVTCRPPGYSCTYLVNTDSNTVLTGCFPNGNLDCNPTDKAGCTTGTGLTGGCVRQAIEDSHGGNCLSVCQPSDSCEPDNNGNTFQCVYLDFRGGGDAFVGSLCFPAVAAPKDPGTTCQFANDCADGYQCDSGSGGSNKCLKLCRQGKPTPKCSTGTTCQDAFNICSGPGLCK